jgi:CheY-like chemotaxis protein
LQIIEFLRTLLGRLWRRLYVCKSKSPKGQEVDVYNELLLASDDSKSRVYSLLITDVAMPRMDGFELYKHVKKLDDRIKVVFVTASEINYEALNELSQVDQLDISEDEDKAATLKGDRKGDEERIHFIRKPDPLIMGSKNTLVKAVFVT